MGAKVLKRALVLTLLGAAVATGCRVERSDTTPRWSKSRNERLALFAGVEKLAVAAFRDPGKTPGMDPEEFARLVADELLALKRFKIIFPRQLSAAARQENLVIKARALTEKREPGEDEVIDLLRSDLDAVHAARAAGADAVLVASVHDFEVYPPKRLAATFRVYLSGAPQRAFQEIIQMSDAGVPLEIGGSLRDRFIWERQWHYDAGRKRTRTSMTWHARKHEKDRGFGYEISQYSTPRFLGFVASDIGGMLLKDSQWYRSNAGAKLARRHGIDYDGLRGPSGGSGYRPGDGDYGVGRGRGSRGRSSKLNLGSSSRGVGR